MRRKVLADLADFFIWLSNFGLDRFFYICMNAVVKMCVNPTKP